MTSVNELRNLVNWKEGLVSAKVHFDQEMYERELERVWGRSWMVVGHEDQIREPGDYITNYMGDVPVIVIRDQQGKIRVFVNSCAHRGNQVCLFDRGNAKSFTCSYHGWTYDTSGNMIGAAMEKEVYRGELNREGWGLDEVPKVASFKGLLFASLDGGAVNLEEWLGEDSCWWLQHSVLSDHLGGLEALPGWHRYKTPGNWKLLSENFIGDGYHVGAATHTSAQVAGRDMMNEGIWTGTGTYPRSSGEELYDLTTNYGKGMPLGLCRIAPDREQAAHGRDLQDAERLGPEAVQWVEERRRRNEEALEGRSTYGFMHGLIFPHVGLMGFHGPMVGRHFILFHPRGVDEMEQWQWTMVEKDAPQSVKDLAAQRVYQGQHMAGVIAPDDIENLERMVEARRSPRTWRRAFHYRMMLGHEGEGGPTNLPGTLGPNPSEVNQREFYRHWLKLMESE
jgi:phenylpropionate dioxygenase-like ring-hydroxylating dioxygenase large terminal subunit